MGYPGNYTGRLSQENCKLEANLVYIVESCFKTQTNVKNELELSFITQSPSDFRRVAFETLFIFRAVSFFTLCYLSTDGSTWVTQRPISIKETADAVSKANIWSGEGS